MLVKRAMKKFKRSSHLRGVFYYLRCLMRDRPNYVNIEVTKRCNAKCDFCSYWEDKSPPELEDYTAVVKEFKPVVVSLSGGEPLVRRNLHEIIRGFRPYCHYVGMVTNGILLNEERAKELFSAGLNQLSVSLDYLDATHDKRRGIPGLFEKITKTVPLLAQKGYNIVFNTVIMDSNLDQIVDMALKAKEWGVGISFSTYCYLKKNDKTHSLPEEKHRQLISVLDELKKIKRSSSHIKNSNYYLDRIPEFVMNGGIPDCKAGKKWVQVTPDGYLQPCSELPSFCHFSEYSKDKIPEISCTKCWYACRGESEANPLHPRRLIELVKS